MKMRSISPILWTKDLNQTASFYCDVLGFSVMSTFPNFVAVHRDNIHLMFVLPQDEPEDCKDPNGDGDFFPGPILTGSIYIYVERVDELWSKVKDQATIKTSIADREYLMRDFSILDNNGYEIVFGQDISKK